MKFVKCFISLLTADIILRYLVIMKRQLSLIILVLYFCILLITKISVLNTTLNFQLVWFSVVLLIILFGLKKININEKDNLSPDIIFITLFYIFHFGYIYLYIAGLVEYDNEIFMFPQLFNDSILYITLCANSFLIGYYISYKPNVIKSTLNVNINNYGFFSIKILLFLLGLSFWIPIISLAPNIFYDYSLVVSIGENGFGGKFYWFGQIVGISIVSLYYITKSKYHKNFLSEGVDLIPLSIMFGSFIIGLRTYFLYYAVVLLVIYDKFYRSVKILKLFTLSLIILSCASIIATSRVYSVYNPIEAVNLAISNSEQNIIISVIKEFGLSFKTIPFIIHLTDNSNNFWYGKSYIDSLLLIIPNVVGAARTAEDNMDTWVTYKLFGSDTFGRGGSIAMEAYGNFGILGGVIFFALLGYILARLYNNFLKRNNIYQLVFYLSFLGGIVLWMRANSNFIFRIIVWSFIITYIVKLMQKMLERMK